MGGQFSSWIGISNDDDLKHDSDGTFSQLDPPWKNGHPTPYYSCIFGHAENLKWGSARCSRPGGYTICEYVQGSGYNIENHLLKLDERMDIVENRVGL